MKLNQWDESRAKPGVGRTFAKACLASCQKVLTQIKKVKDGIFEESHAAFGTHEHLLRLALNEAEALAWQTAYPHLVFPDLATEKVRAVIAWENRQQALGQGVPIVTLAA